jgi:hypothetical protein
MRARHWVRSVAVVAAITLAVAVAGGAPAVAGAGNNDATGDNRADLMAMYDYGNGEAGLFVFPGTARIEDGSTQPQGTWFTEPRNFWPSVTKVTSGDFNGDGRSDFLAMYDYGNGAAGLFVFPGGAGDPYRVWYAPPGNFWLSASKITSGDFNHDGKADVLALYDYGNESAGLWVFPGTTGRSDGASDPYRVWFTGRGGFDVNRAKIAGGDFNLDGRDDLVALYDYGNSEAGLWVFPGTPNVGDGSSNPYMVWNVPAGHFNVGAVRHTDIDDINGDGIVDFLAITDTVVNRFSGTTASGTNATIRGEYSTIPAVNGQGKIIVGDYDGNGVADIIFLRDHGGGSASLAVLSGGYESTPPRPVVRVWYTGAGGFWPSVTKTA